MSSKAEYLKKLYGSSSASSGSGNGSEMQAKTKKKKSTAARNPTVRIVDDETVDWMNVKPVEFEDNFGTSNSATMTKKWKIVAAVEDDKSNVEISPPTNATSEEQQAKTVYRDVKGKIIDIEEERKRIQREQELKDKEELKRREENKGTAQKMAIEKQSRIESEAANAPFSRYVDDEDLNRDLKNRHMWDDPMSKSAATTKNQAKSIHKVCPFAGPSNRFGISPGYKWDGVDRSNGFEKKWLAQNNSKQAQQEEAYKWSVEDM